MNSKIKLHLTFLCIIIFVHSQHCNAMEQESLSNNHNQLIINNNKARKQFLEYLIESGLIEKSSDDIKKRLNESFSDENELRTVSAIIHTYVQKKRINQESLLRIKLEQKSRNTILLSSCPEFMKSLTEDINSNTKYIEKLKQLESAFEVKK